MEHPGSYQNQEVVILGLARSGLAAAKLFHDMGAKVVANDKKARELCLRPTNLRLWYFCYLRAPSR